MQSRRKASSRPAATPLVFNPRKGFPDLPHQTFMGRNVGFKRPPSGQHQLRKERSIVQEMDVATLDSILRDRFAVVEKDVRSNGGGSVSLRRLELCGALFDEFISQQQHASHQHLLKCIKSEYDKATIKVSARTVPLRSASSMDVYQTSAEVKDQKEHLHRAKQDLRAANGTIEVLQADREKLRRQLKSSTQKIFQTQSTIQQMRETITKKEEEARDLAGVLKAIACGRMPVHGLHTLGFPADPENPPNSSKSSIR
ncbi:hypothetical protein BSKO_01456 [Bryopsis sp. KO-2023]|nr:hypothetical protein BSKO_01456 [Bryopsis sp. KO-2023]